MIPAEFRDFEAVYPERAGDKGIPKAVRAARARIVEGHTWAEMIEGARRYSIYIGSTGNTGTQFVKQMATFLGPDKHFLEPWTPAPGKADLRLAGNLGAAHEFLNGSGAS